MFYQHFWNRSNVLETPYHSLCSTIYGAEHSGHCIVCETSMCCYSRKRCLGGRNQLVCKLAANLNDCIHTLLHFPEKTEHLWIPSECMTSVLNSTNDSPMALTNTSLAINIYPFSRTDELRVCGYSHKSIPLPGVKDSLAPREARNLPIIHVTKIIHVPCRLSADGPRIIHTFIFYYASIHWPHVRMIGTDSVATVLSTK